MSHFYTNYDRKKLNILFRVEPGCLGENGSENVDFFCSYAQDALANAAAHFIICTIVPRYDKSLQEFEYQVNGKYLTLLQVEQYLKLFGSSSQEIEQEIAESVALLINSFLDRKSGQ